MIHYILNGKIACNSLLDVNFNSSNEISFVECGTCRLIYLYRAKKE